MAAKKRTNVIQLVDGRWYAFGFGGEPFTEECCDCGLVHEIKYKVENGKMWVQYQRSAPRTCAARKARGIEHPLTIEPSSAGTPAKKRSTTASRPGAETTSRRKGTSRAGS